MRSLVLPLAAGTIGLILIVIGVTLAVRGRQPSRLESALASTALNEARDAFEPQQEPGSLEDGTSAQPSGPMNEELLARLAGRDTSGTTIPTEKQPGATITSTTLPPTTTTIPTAAVTASIAIGEEPGTKILGIRSPWASGLTVGSGSVWTVRPDTGTLYRVDTTTNDVVATIQVAGKGTNATAYSLAFGFGSVFVADNLGSSVVRVDAVSDQVVATIDVGRALFDLAVSDTVVWVLKKRDGANGIEVAGIDPATNEVVSRFPVSDSPLDGGRVAVGRDGLWLQVNRGPDGFLVKLDPGSGEILLTTPNLVCPGGLTVDAEGVWLTNGCSNLKGRSVVRIDTSDGSIAEKIYLRGLGSFTKSGDVILSVTGSGERSELQWWVAPWMEDPDSIALSNIASVYDFRFVDGTVWLTTDKPARLVRIGGPFD